MYFNYFVNVVILTAENICRETMERTEANKLEAKMRRSSHIATKMSSTTIADPPNTIRAIHVPLLVAGHPQVAAVHC